MASGQIRVSEVQLLARVDEVRIVDDVVVQLEQLSPAALDVVLLGDLAQGVALDDLVLAVALLYLLTGRGLGADCCAGRCWDSCSDFCWDCCSDCCWDSCSDFCWDCCSDCWVFCCAAPESADAPPPSYAAPDRPLPQTGQAPLPWLARTFSAISICWALDAWSAVAAYCVPPYPAQVEAENWRP